MYDELIAALRGPYDSRTDILLMKQAADAIEELQKRVPPVPHGRLIDADAEISFNLTMDSGKCQVALFAPTIIESEEST